MKSVKYLHKFFSENIWYAKIVYLLGGIGLGIYLSNPIAGEHPVRWALGFLAVSGLLHLYPLLTRKK